MWEHDALTKGTKETLAGNILGALATKLFLFSRISDAEDRERLERLTESFRAAAAEARAGQSPSLDDIDLQVTTLAITTRDPDARGVMRDMKMSLSRIPGYALPV